jgi:hypothetical protein
MTAQIATALGPALDEPGSLQQPSTVHVSEGSLGDIAVRRDDVRFSHESGRQAETSPCPLSAKSRHSVVSFDHHFAGRCQVPPRPSTHSPWYTSGWQDISCRSRAHIGDLLRNNFRCPPTCPRCGFLMRTSRTASSSSGTPTQSYECAQCDGTGIKRLPSQGFSPSTRLFSLRSYGVVRH